MVVGEAEAVRISKNGVDMRIYDTGLPHASVAYQETGTGHSEEFRHHSSDFIFFIIEGSGEWVIEDEVVPVRAHDLVVVPKGKRFYYRGRLKQLCITAPGWVADHEEHIRDVAL